MGDADTGQHQGLQVVYQSGEILSTQGYYGPLKTKKKDMIYTCQKTELSRTKQKQADFN